MGNELQEIPPPNMLRRWFNQQVIPMAIDSVAAVEVGLGDLADHAQRRPLPLLAGALLAGIVMAVLTSPRSYRR